MAHTPTSWYVEVYEGRIVVRPTEDAYFQPSQRRCIADCSGSDDPAADADLIVRSVNAHDLAVSLAETLWEHRHNPSAVAHWLQTTAAQVLKLAKGA